MTDAPDPPASRSTEHRVSFRLGGFESKGLPDLFSPAPSSSRSAPPVIRILEVAYGRFPEVDGLNEDFSPDSRRIKVQIEVHAREGGGESDPAVLLGRLSDPLPGLHEHRCGGDSRIGRTFVGTGESTASTAEARIGSADLAHLLEHLILDLQNRIAGVTRCSGVTCGHWEPRSRYDLFVESPTALCAGTSTLLAVALMNDHLANHAAIPLYGLGIRISRQLYLCHPWPRGDKELAAPLDEPPSTVREAAQHLVGRAVLRKIPMTVNFGGEDQYGLAAAPFPWTRGPL